MIVSQRKIEANRRNAARSTGPRTAAGKARSSQNGTRHGLAGREVRLSKAEQEARRRLRIAWFDHYAPRCDAEREAIAAAAHAQIVLRHIQRLAAEIEGMRPVRELNFDAVRLLVNYEKPWACAFHRAVNAFRRLREQHERRARQPSSASEPTAPLDETPVTPGHDAQATPPATATHEPVPASPQPARSQGGAKRAKPRAHTHTNSVSEPTARIAVTRWMATMFGTASRPARSTDKPSPRRRFWPAIAVLLAIAAVSPSPSPTPPGRQGGARRDLTTPRPPIPNPIPAPAQPPAIGGSHQNLESW